MDGSEGNHANWNKLVQKAKYCRFFWYAKSRFKKRHEVEGGLFIRMGTQRREEQTGESDGGVNKIKVPCGCVWKCHNTLCYLAQLIYSSGNKNNRIIWR
jgi:hypothetical protein